MDEKRPPVMNMNIEEIKNELKCFNDLIEKAIDEKNLKHVSIYARWLNNSFNGC